MEIAINFTPDVLGYRCLDYIDLKPKDSLNFNNYSFAYKVAFHFTFGCANTMKYVSSFRG